MIASESFIAWLTDPANWTGPDGMPMRVLEHLQISGISLALAGLVAIPAGVAIGHTRKAEFIAVQAANLGRAIPSFAILTIVYQLMLTYVGAAAFGLWPTVVALTLLGIPPILTNGYVGVQQVDPDAVEAARGMGMTGRQVLRQLEIPLATPLILAGTRTAAVQIVATATLAALIAGGGLGRYIVDGFQAGNTTKAFVGAVLVALLAGLTELAFGFLTRIASPRFASQGERGST